MSSHFSLDSVLGAADRAAAGGGRPSCWRSWPSRASRCVKRSPAGPRAWAPSGYSGLALLRSQHLVRGTGLGSLDEVETYHDRIRETVVNMLTDERRRELHGCLARELEEAGGADPETLAVHFEGAGELREGRPLLRPRGGRGERGAGV